MLQFIEKMPDRQRKVFYIAVLILFAVLVDRLLIHPALNKIGSIESAIAQEEKSIQEDLRVLSDKKSILADSDALKDFYTLKVGDDDVINREFFRIIESLAAKNSVNLIKSNRADPFKSKKYIEYYASLDCIGTLENMIAFMHELNSLNELVKVSQFNMSAKKGASNEISASMTVVKRITNPSMINDVDEP